MSILELLGKNYHGILQNELSKIKAALLLILITNIL